MKDGANDETYSPFETRRTAAAGRRATDRGFSFLSAKAHVVKSEVEGQGIFAVEPFVPGELVAVWGGHMMNYAQMKALPAQVARFVVQVWDDAYIGARELSEVEAVDYMNHSCDPTCGIRGSIVVVARRDVAAGEELTFDYAMTETADYELDCLCRTQQCRGRVTGTDWTIPELQRNYEGFFSTYIDEMIRRSN